MPILLVTARRDVSLSAAIEAGANDLIYKPLDLDEVVVKVRTLLNRD